MDYLPYDFTEYGVLMLANILRGKITIPISMGLAWLAGLARSGQGAVAGCGVAQLAGGGVAGPRVVEFAAFAARAELTDSWNRLHFCGKEVY